MWDEFKALAADPSYVKTNKILDNSIPYSVNYLHLSFSLWMYVRALDKVINLSPFVKSIDTVVGDQGGTFSVALNDVATLDAPDKWSDTYYSYLYKVQNGKYNLSILHKLIQQNDIVFIRYERLDAEDNFGLDGFDTEIMKSNLPGKVYDMMGLVDLSSETYSSDANVSIVNVSGRDFTKMITEDSSVFFPFALVNGGKDFFLAYDPKHTVFKRMFVGEQFSYQAMKLYRSIRDSVGFIFNQLTNVGVLPKDSDLFAAYKNSYNRATKKYEDRTSKAYEVDGSTPEYLSEIEQNGVWKVIKAVVDHHLDDRRLGNGELSSPEGTIADLLNRICMSPFVELWGDTMGDQFVFMMRQPPFTKSQIEDYFQDEKNKPIVVTADDVIDLSASWDDTYYTWYQLQPLEGLFGTGQFIAGTVMPVVYFEEYANLYGMHKKVVSDSYLSMEVLGGEQEKVNVDLFRQSLANDLKFLIESSSVLPFTRKGTITLIGDRRIKKGMWIEFEPTGEIFYVRQVSNQVSVNGNTLGRTTTLSVERGMIKQYAVGKSDRTINGKNINYFDVVNMQVILDQLQVKLVDGRVEISKSSSNAQLVDPDLFDFFSKRKQWQ